jgi:hypothetical protein
MLCGMCPAISEQPNTNQLRGALGGFAVGSPVVLNHCISMCSAKVLGRI